LGEGGGGDGALTAIVCKNGTTCNTSTPSAAESAVVESAHESAGPHACTMAAAWGVSSGRIIVVSRLILAASTCTDMHSGYAPVMFWT
jgi:hypothetical protein